MTKMLQQFQFAVGALGENGSAERLHDLLDCNGLGGELIFGRAAKRVSVNIAKVFPRGHHPPNETESSHADRLQIGVPVRRSTL